MQSTGKKTEATAVIIAAFAIVNAYKPGLFPPDVQTATIVILTAALGYFARIRATRANGGCE